ncbi:hypothetical protein IV203_034993 [Nitzschia inconspicua]|uniref:Uncharacterized protein n=1 Tax=Nitzschia inconspicua TaxID=303405 RepID=A0A9K3LDP0_9STRA|nr:hypothetical protein IV203_034993 [Nitzschia inconspicua]
MVSPISARLLAGTREDSPLSDRLLQGRGDATSQGSSSSSSERQKRAANGALKNVSATDEKVSSRISGYSADKEDLSVLPPVLSIDLHGRDSSNNIMSCPKRQKTNDMCFAATTAGDDLERAGMEFKTVNREMEEVQVPGTQGSSFRIKLKGVRLIHSKEVSGPLISSNVSKNTTVGDYMELFRAIRDYYPTPSRAHMKSLEQTPNRDGSSSSDTSSVSDTESDSESDNINNGRHDQLLFLPPRVEDSLDQTKVAKWNIAETISSPCNVISSASNVTTMAESLQLSKEPRLVTLSTEPYSIIHANAAFMRLSGRDHNDPVLGTSFRNLLDPEANDSLDDVNLTSCMVSSSSGSFSKLFLRPKASTLQDQIPVECSMRVSPIVERKTLNREVTTVSHFAIELFENIRNGSDYADISLGSMTNNKASHDLPVGVMG